MIYVIHSIDNLYIYRIFCRFILLHYYLSFIYFDNLLVLHFSIVLLEPRVFDFLKGCVPALSYKVVFVFDRS